MVDVRGSIIALCAKEIGLTTSEIMSISATAPRRYFIWTVPKRSGKGERIICHPARELKAIQKIFQTEILANLPVHPAAMAYVRGGSIKRNAQMHAHSRVILKLDFVDFFHNLTVNNWHSYSFDHFPEWTALERDFAAQILFWAGIRPYKSRCLAIGAPTSPLLSNALMFEVDVKLTEFAAQAGLKYTRYADDITFSTMGHLNADATVNAVKVALAAAKYTNLRLNDEKTNVVSNRFGRRVTGLVITPVGNVSLGRDRKRLISAMVHRASVEKLDAEDRPKLTGLIAFALDVEPMFVGTLKRKYSSNLIDDLLKWGTRKKPLFT